MEQQEQQDPTTTTPPHRQLSRDQCLQIQTLRSVGPSYQVIANHLKVTQRQVQHTYQKITLHQLNALDGLLF